MNRDQKAAAIEEIAANIRESDAVFAVDYRGLSVPQIGELRTRLRAADARFSVVKNTLTERAADAADRKSTRLNSSHANISYAVFCLKKKINYTPHLVLVQSAYDCVMSDCPTPLSSPTYSDRLTQRIFSANTLNPSGYQLDYSETTLA